MTRLDAATEARLLGRTLRSSLPAAVRGAFTGRRVLVTGAGGSVGSELARQLAGCRPSEIVLFDHAEYLLFRASRELQEAAPGLPVVAVLGDVSRARDISAACRTHQPHFVFHAAACKHVTIAEQNIVTAARTNVLGAVYAARAARACGARFVLISTDKAAEPHSVMGATKRLAERCVLERHGGVGAIAVRFGNVLGSSGSVVEILMEAARAGRPLTVTDPDATRFFMTAAEAVSLVLKAAVSHRTGEVLWLDMGRPLRLGDLVERIVALVAPADGPRPPVTVIGLRPGEKRHEELTTRGMATAHTDDAVVWSARHAPGGDLSGVVARLRQACARGDAELALRLLEHAVPDYVPSLAARGAAGRGSRPAPPAPFHISRPRPALPAARRLA